MTAENDARTVRKRSRGPVLLLGVLVVLLLLWCAYWFAAYRMADSFVGTAEAAQPATGAAVGCNERAFGGFPFRLTINCSGASAATAEGIRATIGPVAASAPLYAPGRVVAGIMGPLAVAAPDFALNAVWDRASVTADAGLIGTVNAMAALDGLDVTVISDLGAPIWSARAAQWGTEIRPAEAADALRVVLTADQFVLTLEDTPYPQLSGSASLTLVGTGSRLDRDPMAIFRQWLNAGGAMTIEHASLASGSVHADVSGNLVLELDGTLSGTLAVFYSGPEDLPLLVAAVFPWADDQAQVIADAIVAVSRPIEMLGLPALEVHLMLDHGLLKYGLFPILTIPSVGSLAHLL